jgi:hypothetical protein
VKGSERKIRNKNNYEESLIVPRRDMLHVRRTKQSVKRPRGRPTQCGGGTSCPRVNLVGGEVRLSKGAA